MIQQQIKLKILQVGEPILRKKSRALSEEEILSPFIQELIELMKETLRDAPGVGLAAPQIGVPIQLAVIEDRLELHKMWTTEQLIERERVEVPFHVIINPKLIFQSERVEFFESCLSSKEITGVVPRSLEVEIEYLNELAEPRKLKARGWHARILQHEIDHLNGILCLDKVIPRTFISTDNFFRIWKSKPIAEAIRELIHIDQ
jgi:peptide deformylase